MQLFILLFSIFLIHINVANSQNFNLIERFSGNYLTSESIPNEEAECARIPPLFWCLSQKIIDLCGFNEQCSRYINASKNKPLQITLFYETLCPDCQDFIVDDFLDVYNAFKDFIHVELVPYGNAKRNNDTIECQHGAEECQLNRYENCAIHFMPEPLPFIACLEAGIKSEIKFEKVVRKCYSKFHTIPHIYDQIIHCNQSDMGTRLQIQSAERTENAWPDAHEHVPWIVFNNVSLKSQQFFLRNLPIAICQIISTNDTNFTSSVCEGIGHSKIHSHPQHHSKYHKKALKRNKVL